MTYQQKLEADRESLRQQLAIATRPNCASIGHCDGKAGLMARDNAGLIVLVTLDVPALDSLISEAFEARSILLSAARIDNEPAPDTKRSCPSSAPPEAGR